MISEEIKKKTVGNRVGKTRASSESQGTRKVVSTGEGKQLVECTQRVGKRTSLHRSKKVRGTCRAAEKPHPLRKRNRRARQIHPENSAWSREKKIGELVKLKKKSTNPAPACGHKEGRPAETLQRRAKRDQGSRSLHEDQGTETGVGKKKKKNTRTANLRNEDNIVVITRPRTRVLRSGTQLKGQKTGGAVEQGQTPRQQTTKKRERATHGAEKQR